MKENIPNNKRADEVCRRGLLCFRTEDLAFFKVVSDSLVEGSQLFNKTYYL